MTDNSGNDDPTGLRELILRQRPEPTAALLRVNTEMARMARQMAEQSSVGLAERLRSVADFPAFKTSVLVEQWAMQRVAIEKLMRPTLTMERLLRDTERNLASLRNTHSLATLTETMRFLDMKAAVSAAAYTERTARAALELANSRVFTNLTSLYNFSALTASAERLMRAPAFTIASDFRSPSMLQQAPITEPYRSARALSFFEPELLDSDADASTTVVEEDVAEVFSRRVTDRGWPDIAEFIQAANARVLDSPDAPARMVLFAHALRLAMKTVIDRMASSDKVKVWVADEKSRGVYVPLPRHVKRLRNAKGRADAVRYVMRHASGVCNGYSDFGAFDLTDCLHVLDRLEAAGHSGGEDAYIREEGLEAVFHRAVGFMLVLLEADELGH